MPHTFCNANRADLKSASIELQLGSLPHVFRPFSVFREGNLDAERGGGAPDPAPVLFGLQKVCGIGQDWLPPKEGRFGNRPQVCQPAPQSASESGPKWRVSGKCERCTHGPRFVPP